MKCSGETNLEGLRHPSKYKAFPNEREELFILGWEVVGKEVQRLLNLGWEQDKKGNKRKAAVYYKGANIYFYLVHLGIIVRNFLEREGTLDNSCTSSTAEEKFCLLCVEGNLPCLGKTYGTDYLDAWRKITNLYGIDRQTTNCDECCLGISEMIINDDNDCLSFIIGTCEENLGPEPPYGEFEPCEFVQEEFTQPSGNNIYDNCN